MPDDAAGRSVGTHDQPAPVPAAGDVTTSPGEPTPAHTDRTGPHIPATVAPPVRPRPLDPPGPPGPPGYVLEGELGRGGMGVVYKARHAKLNRTAALKMVLGAARAESNEIIRFLAEAEAVAAVRHPHVVGVYEFGEADGRPFLALEFCPGGTLAEKLKAAGRLDPAAAAELVRKIAAGVAAAHDLGIVHRDLKPANVLFDEAGEPKVSDFGLAKKGAGADVTQSQAVMGTPAYMSPEQAKGESKFVGPQADVWALGVILYECLAGKRPFEADDSWSLLQKVMNDEPPGLRTLGQSVPRDLDLICRKCLVKAGHDRYPTAAELADDLGRFLGGRPITARPAGPVERGWKWAKRNKPAVAVTLALAVLAGVATWQAVAADKARGEAVTEASNARAAGEKERAQKDEAVRQQKAATAAKEFLQKVLGQTDAWGQAGPGRAADPDIKLREALDHAAKMIEGAFPDQPLIEADLRATIGGAYYGLAAHADAEKHLLTALRLRERVLGPDDAETLAVVNYLALLYRKKGDYPTAEGLYERAVAGAEKALGPDHVHTLTSVNNLAVLYQARGKYAAAVSFFRRALAGREKALGPDDPDTLQSVNNLAMLHHDRGEYAAAEPLLHRALAGRERVLGPGHPDTLLSVNNLALLYSSKGESAAAEPLMRRAVAGREKALGPDHPDTLQSVNNLAVLYQMKQNYAAAEPLMRRAVAGREKALGPDHPDTLQSTNNLAHLYWRKGEYAAAEPLLHRALAGYEKALGPVHPDTLLSVNNLAALYQMKGDYAGAEPFSKRALAGYEKSLGPDPPRTRASAHNLAMLYWRKAEYAAAAPLLTRVLAGQEKAHGPGHPDALTSANNLARLYLAMNRFGDAIPLLDRAARGYAERPEMAGSVPAIRSDLGVALLATGKAADAEPHLLAGYDALSKPKTLSPGNRTRLRMVTQGLVELYATTDQPTKAAEWRAKLKTLPPEAAPPPRPAR